MHPLPRWRPPLAGTELAALTAQLGRDWRVVDGTTSNESSPSPISRAPSPSPTGSASSPRPKASSDIHLAWGKVRLTIWTHKIDGLTESDFILARRRSGWRRSLADSEPGARVVRRDA